MINRLPSQYQAPHANGKRPSDAAPDKKTQALAKVARCIGDYPAAALGVAFTAGLILGRLVKR
jgi:ElaB/YqjD/DUF883 family membrane-anchored ribosome-binding protein